MPHLQVHSLVWDPMIEISILVIYDVCLFQPTLTYSKQKHEILFQNVKFSFKKIFERQKYKE